VAMGALARMKRLCGAPGLWIIAFMVAWSAVAALDPAGRYLFQTTLADWATDLRLPLGVAGFVAIAMAFQGIANGAGLLGRVLTSPLLLFCGTISYSLYMWHGPALSVARRLLPLFGIADLSAPGAAVAFPLLGLGLAIPLSLASHRLLELRASTWLRRMFGAGRHDSMTAAGGLPGAMRGG